MEKRGTIKQAWHFLWESNSVWSWIIDFILAFIFIKFIFFPVLSLIFSSALPMVIVESNSMIHQGENFDEWWSKFGSWYENNGIEKEYFKQYKFQSGINKGDIIVVAGNKNKGYEKGDIIVFNVSIQSTPIIHRIVSKGNFYSTKGDNNQYQLASERVINKDQIIGKAIGRIPWLGWIKLIVFNPMKALE
jgi:signal peptidase I